MVTYRVSVILAVLFLVLVVCLLTACFWGAQKPVQTFGRHVDVRVVIVPPNTTAKEDLVRIGAGRDDTLLVVCYDTGLPNYLYCNALYPRQGGAW